MGVNEYYFENKGIRAEVALKHTAVMESAFASQIKFSIANTKVYSPDSLFEYDNGDKYPVTDIIIDPIGTVEAIHKYYNPDNRMTALNFASYKNPGGMFLNGSKAQEECLCHESFLYNVLREFDSSYYKWNNLNKNKAMYLNRALYTPNILFMGSMPEGLTLHQYETPCDIITCAAPNYKAAHRYQGVQREENNDYCNSRIKFILDIAVENDVDTLILGAFGCGVFGQDGVEIATIFKRNLETVHRHKFKQVIFAIPPSNGYEDNLIKFKSVFGVQ